MKKEEFIQEVATRMDIPEQSSSLMLHSIFSQVLKAISTDEEVFVPKLGKWKLIRTRDNLFNIQFEPSEQFIQTLARSPRKNSSSEAASKRFEYPDKKIEQRKGYIQQSAIITEVAKDSAPVNLVHIYKTITSELGTENFKPQAPPPLFSLTSDKAPETAKSFTKNHIEKIIHTHLIQNEIHDIILTSGVLQSLPTSVDLKMDESKSVVDFSSTDYIDPEDDFAKRLEEDDSFSSQSSHEKPGENKSKLLKFIAYFLTVCLVGIGLYFLYSEGFLNHLLPKKYQLLPKMKIPLVVDSTAAKSDSLVQIKSSTTKSKKYKYFLTVRILQKQFDADSRLKQIELQGFYGHIEKSTRFIGGKRWYEVKLGPYTIRDTATATAARFKTTFGYPPTEDSIRIH